MNKSIIIAAAASACFFAAPAFAQDSAKPAGFHGRHGSATTLRDAPRREETNQSSGFGGRNGSATNLRDAPRRGEEARSNGFNGRHGSATNLRDTPSSDPTAGHVKVFDGRTGADIRASEPAAGEMRPATLYGRKSGGDGATAGHIPREIRSSGVAQPRPTRERPTRSTNSNNLKQIGLANH